MAFMDNYMRKRLGAVQPAPVQSTPVSEPPVQAPAQPAAQAPAAPAAPAQTPVVQTQTPQAPAPEATAPAATPLQAAQVQSAPSVVQSKTADFTKTYIDNLTKSLAGQDTVVKNAEARKGTEDAMGRYLASRGAKQESVNAGYTPGTLQSQRTMDRYQAGENEAAFNRSAQVNDLSRQRTDTAMQQANQFRQEDLAQTETLINSVQDPVAKAYLRNIQAQGGDVRSALSGLYEQGDGGFSIKDQYRSDSPAESAYKDAEDWVKVLYPGLTGPEFDAKVQERLGEADEASRAPISQANTAADKAARLEVAQTQGLSALTDEQYEAFANDLPITDLTQVPRSQTDLDAAKATGNTFVKTQDGEVYQVTSVYKQTTDREKGVGKSNRHADYAVATDRDGNTVYIGADGTVHAYKPPDPPNRGQGVSYQNGVWTTASTTGIKYYNPETGDWENQRPRQNS